MGDTSTGQGGTLWVSPHSDDMAMAAAHLLGLNVLPRPYHLATVFSDTDWVEPEWKGRFPTLELVTQARLAEDAEFCARVGASLRALHFPDCSQFFLSPVMDPDFPLDDGLSTQVAQALLDILHQTGCQWMAAPYPWGPRQHWDHRLAYAAALRLAAEHRINLVFVDDLPYSRPPLNSPLTDGLGRSLMPRIYHLNRDDMQKKHALIDIYTTQNNPRYHNGVEQPYPGESGLTLTETLWTATCGETGV